MSPEERLTLVLYVRPTFPAQGALENAETHAVFASHLALASRSGAPSFANLSYGGVGEFCPRAPLTIGMGAVCPCVRHIVGSRRPTKVACTIVQAIAVVVRAVKVITGRWSNKRHQNQSMSAIQFAGAVAPQAIKQIAATFFNVSGKMAILPCAHRGNNASHLTGIADFITRKAGNFFPLHHGMMTACLPKLNNGGH